MGHEEAGFVKIFMKKFGAQLSQRLLNPGRTLRAANKLYQAKATAPAQMARKAIGYGILGASGLGLAGHWLTHPPKEQAQGPSYGNNFYGGE